MTSRSPPCRPRSTAGPEDIERRAAEIKKTIETDAGADLDALNIELGGLQQAKENLQQRSAYAQGGADPRGFDPITGMGFERRGLDAGADVLASAEYRNAFFKTLLGQQLTQVETAAFQRAQAEQRADAFPPSPTPPPCCPPR